MELRIPFLHLQKSERNSKVLPAKSRKFPIKSSLFSCNLSEYTIKILIVEETTITKLKNNLNINFVVKDNLGDCTKYP